jgi:hypothetical protein
MSDPEINFLMSVHYLCQWSAAAKLLCLQLFTYQCHFAKKVVEKRKYVTLYAESWGKQLKAASELVRLWNKGTIEPFSLLFSPITFSLFHLCASFR